jgi:hypothetical protein
MGQSQCESRKLIGIYQSLSVGPETARSSGGPEAVKVLSAFEPEIYVFNV